MTAAVGSGAWRRALPPERTFEDLLYAELRQSRWLLTSLVAHLLLFVLMLWLPCGIGGRDGPGLSVVARVRFESRERLGEARLVGPETLVRPRPEEPPIPSPVVRDVPTDVQTAADSPFEEALGPDPDPSESVSEYPRTLGMGSSGAFGGRGGHRNLRTEGGGAATCQTVALGLEWLKTHQDPDGFWDGDGFDRMCKLNTCDGAGAAGHDAGVTGLALLAFLGTGDTYKHGAGRNTVRDGLKYLMRIQDAEGCFGPRTDRRFVYDHAAAALAMAEAYGGTGSPVLKRSAQAGIDFVEKCRNPYLGWRYGVRPGENDTSVTGFMVLALHSARRAGLRVSPEAFDGAKSWLDSVTEWKTGRVGYSGPGTGISRPPDRLEEFPAGRSESLTAVGMLVRILGGEDPRESDAIRKGVDRLLSRPPRWDESDGSIDFYYWYYGTLAMFKVGGDAWKTWNAALKSAILDHVRRDGDEKGSFDPVDPWGRDGGRVYSTALGVMCLEVYWRCSRVFGTR